MSNIYNEAFLAQLLAVTGFHMVGASVIKELIIFVKKVIL